MHDFFLATSMAILVTALLCLYRVVFGPSIIDRIVASNIIGTKTTVVILLMGFIFYRVEMFIDIALLYALINFIGTLAFSKYFERKGVLNKEQQS